MCDAKQVGSLAYQPQLQPSRRPLVLCPACFFIWSLFVGLFQVHFISKAGIYIQTKRVFNEGIGQTPFLMESVFSKTFV